MGEKDKNKYRDKHSLKRLDTIFEGINAGKTADQIDTDLLREEEKAVIVRKAENEQIGSHSEMRAATILRQIDIVTSVRPTKQFDKEDRRGIDIKVSLQLSEKNLFIKNVKVQVKSSGKSIEEFKRDLMRRFKLSSLDSVNEWLLANHFIVLNGLYPEELISDSFHDQLRDINEYYKNQRRKK